MQIDGRDLVDFDVMKWNRISKKVMVAGFFTLVRDGASCKDKWHKICPISGALLVIMLEWENIMMIIG